MSPRRQPAKSACLEGPMLEAHIGTLFTDSARRGGAGLRASLALPGRRPLYHIIYFTPVGAFERLPFIARTPRHPLSVASRP